MLLTVRAGEANYIKPGIGSAISNQTLVGYAYIKPDIGRLCTQCSATTIANAAFTACVCREGYEEQNGECVACGTSETSEPGGPCVLITFALKATEGTDQEQRGGV